MELIALSGYARSGKDAAAAVLVEEFGFKRVAFADKLREVLYQLDPIVNPAKSDYFVNPKHVMSVQDVIDQYGWDGYKETVYGNEIRRLLQRLGTEAGRQTLWDSIWIDAALTGHDDDAKLCITDVRFPNEAQAIKDLGGDIWRVRRKDVGPANSHSSETSLDDWKFDKVLMNYGSLDEWRDQVRSSYAGGF